MEYKEVGNYKNYLLSNNIGNITSRCKVASDFVNFLEGREPTQKLIDEFCINPTRKSIIKYFLLSNDITVQQLEESTTISSYNKEIERFLRYKQTYACTLDSTLKIYKKRLENLYDFLRGQEPTNELITYFISQKKTTEKVNYSNLFNQYFKFLKSDIEQIKISKKQLDNERFKVIKDKILSREQIKKLLEYSEKLDIENFEEFNIKSIILYSVFLGTRVSELYNSDTSKIDLKGKIITLRGKGNKYRDVAIDTNKTLLEHVRIHLKLYKNKPLILNRSHQRMAITTMQKKVKKIFEELGFEDNKSIHSLRHSFGTLLYENGVDLNHIKTVMGHSDIKTTKIYVRVSNVANKAIKGKMKI